MKYRHQKYTWSKPFGTVNHNWELVGPVGAVHFHVSFYNDEASCGLEFHDTRQRNDDAPDHVDCPLTGGRCWHDGTSLYARERLWPLIEGPLRAGNHETVFRILEGEADRHFAEATNA